jgi:cellulose synthase/poly-beta-1,6-N-acetylglucosamine synthase-like glycosyltransferase
LKNFNNEQLLLEHYINHGKIEGRICSQNELDDIIYENKLSIDFQATFLQDEQFKNDTENKLNILVRTSKRPEFFKQCIESILSQKYTNYHIYICYDTMESYEYIKDYLINSNITCFFVENDSTEKYKFNLYEQINH